MGEIKTITEKIKKFRDERDWKQFHNHVAIAPAILDKKTRFVSTWLP